MDRDPDKTLENSTPPIPAARKRRTNRTADENRQAVEEESVNTTVKRTEYVQTKYESHEETAHYVAAETPTDKLRQKIAKYEQVWSSGGGMKRGAAQSSDELRRAAEDDDSLCEIDVFEIEKRLREERKRGLAEAEAAKLAFQQVHLRATPQPSTPPRRVEIREEYTASPFNVTLKTSTKLSPGTPIERLTEAEDYAATSPFNVTLRTTRRKRKEQMTTNELEQSSPFNVTLRTITRSAVNLQDPKIATAQFLANEKTVREVKAIDGVRTIVTSSMTSDGRSHEEKIFRHGEGYISPHESPLREGSMTRSISSYSSGRSSVTPPRSIDMTAGGRRILIKLEDECEPFDIMDETDSVQARIRQFQQRTADNGVNMGVDNNVALGTYPNIDITVGSNPHRQRFYQQQQQHRQQLDTEMEIDERESVEKQVTVETGQQDHVEMPWQTTKSGKTTMTIKKTTTTRTTTTKETNKSTTGKAIEKSSITESRQLQGSSTEESRQIAKTSTNERIIGNKRVVFGIAPTTTTKTTSDNTDDSDTEGVKASSLVIISTPQQQKEEEEEEEIKEEKAEKLNASASTSNSSSTLSKGLSSYQIQQQQSANNEYQEFQSNMAAKSFTRSNSQYDCHIKELRGN